MNKVRFSGIYVFKMPYSVLPKPRIKPTDAVETERKTGCKEAKRPSLSEGKREYIEQFFAKITEAIDTIREREEALSLQVLSMEVDLPEAILEALPTDRRKAIYPGTTLLTQHHRNAFLKAFRRMVRTARTWNEMPVRIKTLKFSKLWEQFLVKHQAAIQVIDPHRMEAESEDRVILRTESLFDATPAEKPEDQSS